MLAAAGAVALAAAALMLCPPRALRRGLSWFGALARRRVLAAASVALLALAARLALLPLLPEPVPVIPDEFSYLLLGKTLAAGKLANRTHPLWEHFETLFVLQRPAYASVYPPAQGVALAAGLLAFHDAWAGVWLSVGLWCFALCWMLQGWLPPRWACLGALLGTLQLGILSYWMNSFWGGCPAALGGALVFGALPRLRFLRVGDALLMGAGFAILANSRPFEGLAVSLPVAGVLLWRWARLRKADLSSALRRQVAPLLLVLTLAAVFDGFYFYSITGSAWKMPYQAYADEYAAAPAFLWQRPREAPPYRHETLRDAHQSFRIDYARYATFAGFARASAQKLGGVANFYLGPLWVVPAILLPAWIREKRFRILRASMAAGLLAILATVPFQAHYAAPLSAIFYLLTAYSLRRISALRRRGLEIGRYLVPAAPLVCVAALLYPGRPPQPQSRLVQRPALEKRLAAAGNAHLVIVRYGPHHALGEEWVYNEPDIDRAGIVWARDMGMAGNRAVMRYFARRDAWLLEPDEDPVRLTRLARPAAASLP